MIKFEDHETFGLGFLQVLHIGTPETSPFQDAADNFLIKFNDT